MDLKNELSWKEEIRRAVESVVCGGNKVREVEPVKFEYCFTCALCGCHVLSRFVFDGVLVEVCGGCQGFGCVS